MKCKQCGAKKFRIAGGSEKYCIKCGAVPGEVWNKTDRLMGSA